MIKDIQMYDTIEEGFRQYAGAVLQSRALVDVRDCLKPSARQIFYCLYTDKFTSNKPYKKVLKMIGSIARIYIHGDSSAEGIIMRAGQPFSMRYPLVEVKGNGGNLQKSGNWAAPRYPDARLTQLTDKLFEDLPKNTIQEWRLNYDDTEEYPAILPTKGFYNIVNGTMGIGVGAASSVPQFNLREVNKALIILLQNPNVSFEEIYCVPDFATGATLLNEKEVKESLRNGTGAACKIRSTIEFDAKEKCLVVTEIPYGVYTNTICEQLEEIEQSDENPGIERHNDLTGKTPLLKIYLTKNANPDKVIRYLYKRTSLQSFYSINMTMLENGRFPKIYGWKEALQAHIDHEKEVYRRGFEFDLKKILHRVMIIEGLLKAIDAIDKVITTIKSSTSTAAASIALQKLLNINEEQAKAILDIKLSRLAKLEITKLVDEKEKLEKEADRINEILKNEELFNNELIKGWKEVAEKFGDERRTKILNIESESDEPTEVKNLILNVTNKNNLFIEEASALYTTRRRSVGTKFKLDKDEFVISASNIKTTDTLLFFTDDGLYYSSPAAELPYEKKTPIEAIIQLKEGSTVCACTSYNLKDEKQFIIFVTKKGYLKKSHLSEYNTKRKMGVAALTLENDDKIISVSFTNLEKIGILTKDSNFIICETKDIRPIGRISRGVKGIKLNDNDYVVAAKLIPSQMTSLVSITEKGLIKQMSSNEFTVSGRYTKGAKIHKSDDNAADFLPITSENELIVCSNKTQTKILLNEIPSLSKQAAGVKCLKLNENQKIVNLTFA